MIRIHSLASALSVAAFNALILSSSHAQSDFPSKPIRMVVPFAAGGSTDVVARILSHKLGEALGQPLVIENRPGAGSTVGVDSVAKSIPDGYTIAITANSAVAPGPLMRTHMPYDPIKDLAHIALIGTFVNSVQVRSDSPIKSLGDLIDTARTHPGKLTYSTAGIGSSGWLTGELLKRQAKIDMLHGPDKGVGPAFVDLLAGRIDVMFQSAGAVAASIRDGKIRLLAESGAKRSRAYPDVPAIVESVSGVSGGAWFGVAASAKTPLPTLLRLEKDFTTVLRDADTRKRLEDMGMFPSGVGSAATLAHIHAENALYGPIIKSMNIKVE